MAVTRDDVARAAGVSVATVSYVLNEGPRPVSEDKRRRVLRAVDDLGYRPNAIARSLRARRTRILGLVLPDSANPYFAALSHAIEEAAAARVYQVVVANAAERPEREAGHIEALLRLQVDGLIWIPADLRRAARGARAGGGPAGGEGQGGVGSRTGWLGGRGAAPGVPMVQVDRTLDLPAGGSTGLGSRAGGVGRKGRAGPGHAPAYDVVESDNTAGGRLAAEHLLALGHRRLACLAGPADHLHALARLHGFREVLRAVGGAPGTALVAHGSFDYASGAAVAARWCALPPERRPTGIVCGNDAMAIGALSAIAQAGLRVPQDVSVTGYDDLPQAAYTVPPLTTVAQPLAAIAAAAVERLLLRIERPDAAPAPGHTVLPVRLVVRRSTAPPAPD